ncbi:hypothetical protein ILP92_06670 [Maribius pontilimi]|uniref:Uncharacterized protein n=1 Tax=Palleronia pontilimi TaxID=1964209 RepID=A0A934IH06_9RHOB|nr:hypothetical protein [Palleronia pontilimi]MBJ3762425.1 hypothetical protein [Palleronia pontilimi]
MASKNGKFFSEIAERIGARAEAEGFIPHPAYIPGWDPGNQDYSRYLLWPDVTQRIDNFEINYRPASEEASVMVHRSPSPKDVSCVQDVGTDPVDWSRLMLVQGSTRFAAQPKMNLWPWSGNSGFSTRKRAAEAPLEEAKRIIAVWDDVAPYLFAALRGEYVGRRVDVQRIRPTTVSW